MTRIGLAGRSAVGVVALLAALALPKPVFSQQEGRIRGTVVDNEGQPLAGARVVVDFEGLARQFELMTNDEGEFVQIGLQPAPYLVTVEKEGFAPVTLNVELRAGQTQTLSFQLLPPAEAALASLSEEERAKAEKAIAAGNAFEQGIEATRTGNYDEAIAKFNEALESSPDCNDCYRNLGIIYRQKEDYARAEAAFKEALELAPDDAATYEGLADAYNAQGKFDEAAEASAQAAKLSGGGAIEGGSATAVFDQGLIFWNAGRIAEAKKQFEATLELDPDHGEVHYWLGMANLNEGNIPGAATELKLYLEREPKGRFAEQAHGILGQIQP